MFYELLQPVTADTLFETPPTHPARLFNQVHFYDGTPVMLEDFDIAIINVDEDRGAPWNEGCGKAAEEIRRQFYQLFLPKTIQPFRIIDLGGLRRGENTRDTYHAMAAIVEHLVNQKVVLVILGGSHDLTFGQYLGYQQLESLVNLVVVDEKIDMDQGDLKKLNAASFLMPVFTHTPNFLFNYSHIGYQTYLNDFKAIDTLESLSFECHRLGLVRAHMEEMEPILRDADMFSIDISGVRMADAPGHALASPNGFSGEELCQLTRYAGMSDRLTTIGFYEINPKFDFRQQTAQLVAQSMWYFIEGYYQRRGDVPVNLDDFLKFIVKMESLNHELIFWKSKKTDRWWMEMPFAEEERFRKHRLIPCSITDYEMAVNEELPDKWMKVWHKMQ